MSRHLRRAGFFDVDETLLTVSSVWRFLLHHLMERHSDRTHAAGEFRRIADDLRARGGTGRSREELCRDFFRLFAGQDAARLAAEGEAWFQAEQARGGVFNRPVLQALSRHAASGDVTVLVSGSFPACLDPVARAVGADTVLCSRPEVRGGRYTGELPLPMIGEAKAAAVLALASTMGIDLNASAAYGDHMSDLPLLRLVGFPVAVGDDPALTAAAVALGGMHISTVPASITAGHGLRQSA
jgi:HAD superfamily hydrolase (TIGR01490 family)